MSKKKYSINWEDDVAISFEVNGVQYASLEDISDEDDRLKLEAMQDSASDAEDEAEFARVEEELEQVKGPSMEQIVLGIFSGVAALMLLITGIASFRNIQKTSREETAAGRVVDVVKYSEYAADDRSRSVGETYYPVVKFVALDGKQRQVQLSEGSSPPSYEVGDEVVVLYEPDHPLDARIKSFASSAGIWILPTITGILGVGFLVAVLAVPKVMLPDEAAL